jgi:HEXXH motif-containing protein
MVHEVWHARLNAALAVSPLFYDDESALYGSPLRPDPRPMFGLFHQMFVLSRLFYFHRRLSSVYEDSRKSVVRVYGQLVAAVRTVAGQAQLDPGGVDLVKSILELTQDP